VCQLRHDRQGCGLFQDTYPMNGLEKTTETGGAKTFGTLHSVPCVNRLEREPVCFTSSFWGRLSTVPYGSGTGVL
jgi:hypothetical protein